jgi:hypothetical protein
MCCPGYERAHADHIVHALHPLETLSVLTTAAGYLITLPPINSLLPVALPSCCHLALQQQDEGAAAGGLSRQSAAAWGGGTGKRRGLRGQVRTRVAVLHVNRHSGRPGFCGLSVCGRCAPTAIEGGTWQDAM